VGKEFDVRVLEALGHALNLAFAMTWEVTWALILGFALSGAVQAVVSKAEMSRLLRDASPRSLAVATGLGAASSSCSYAAVAVARSIFRKGGNFTAAMAFEIASTNLVIELGIIIAVLIGWQFTLAEFVGGPLMIVFVALVAVVSFVCSIGNVPLAAVLWNGGISFGGVVSFIYADLIVLPILNIYRKYYGGRMSLVVLGTFFAAMAAAGYVVEFLFGAARLVPDQRKAKVLEATVTLNYTTVLNLVFLGLAAVLVIRFLRTGGREMLARMSSPSGKGDRDTD
jgi:uncharacterized membrane protein YraQ (UPF0718 family)